MKVSIDISMYPLQEKFETPIIEFIKKLRNSGFVIKENSLSTQIFGEYLEVMNFINQNIHEAFLDDKKCVFVLKIVSEDRSHHEPNY